MTLIGMAMAQDYGAAARAHVPTGRKDYQAYAFCFAASSIWCTRPPGCDSAVMSLFSSAAGAVQMDQLNQ